MAQVPGQACLKINPGLNGSSIELFEGIDDTLFFSANDGANGKELWKSDGNETGTVLVKDIYEGALSSDPEIIKVGETIYVYATDRRGRELWKTDGTEIGTILIKDINQGSESSLYLPSSN